MAFTQTDLDALKAALASGELRVKYAGREVEYRSIEELKQAIAIVEGDLETTTPVRRVVVHTSKGT